LRQGKIEKKRRGKKEDKREGRKEGREGRTNKEHERNYAEHV